MIGRPTAEIVAELRNLTDGNGWPSVVYEAADRLERLEVQANAAYHQLASLQLRTGQR